MLSPPLRLSPLGLPNPNPAPPRPTPPSPPPTPIPAPAHPPTPSITVRKSRYDLGKKFFTNITPGYQQYAVVYLLPWTDPSAPGARAPPRCRRFARLRPPANCPRAATAAASHLSLPAPCHPASLPTSPAVTRRRHPPPPTAVTRADDYFLLFYSCRTGQVVRFTSSGEFLPMWNFPGMEKTVGGGGFTPGRERAARNLGSLAWPSRSTSPQPARRPPAASAPPASCSAAAGRPHPLEPPPRPP
jgi:hypothetical protein